MGRHSEETKNKISQTLRGRKHTDETKRKISSSLEGRKLGPMSDEHKKKLSESKKGRKASDETKRKLSVAYKGNKSNTGRKLSEEHIEKMRISSTGRKLSEEARQKISMKKKGVRRPDLSASMKKRWEDPVLGEIYLEKALENGLKRNKFRDYYISPKAGRVVYRSSYELKFYQYLDTNETVKSFEVEKERITYFLDGVKRRYIPDVKVIYNDNSYKIFEIKPQVFLDDLEVVEKSKAAVKRHGDCFQILTEVELRQLGLEI